MNNMVGKTFESLLIGGKTAVVIAIKNKKEIWILTYDRYYDGTTECSLLNPHPRTFNKHYRVVEND